MLLYDISNDILTAKVYEGDPEPSLTYIKSTDKGDDYNLSVLSTCMHTGTHIDSPYHFDSDGEKIEDMKLSVFYGKCTVVTIKGILTGEDMERLLPYCKRRLILHGEGEAYLSYSAAVVIADSDIVLIGTDGISVSTAFDEYRTHMEFARANIAVLEGLNLTGIRDGEYTLCAFPVKVSTAEAAPCRAVLMEQEKGI
ncbi:MAG: cyclase family protein [Ruminococcus sp.]|nr:cyclase family protein [Ruminococcus sp.]MDO4420100.1 cyclase family protein [Ruminococcus sp.]